MGNVEGALKSEEALAVPNVGLRNRNGNVIYSTLGFAVNKLGLNASFKRTENFVMRTSPNEVLLKGIFNWQRIIVKFDLNV